MTERRVKLEAFGDLTPAEETLCAEVGTGEVVVIGDGTRPGPEAGDTRQIRADLLRALILNRVKDCPVHDKGVRVAGARIAGRLDLQGCRIARDIVLVACWFDEEPVLRAARLDSLFLHGSALPGLEADRLQAEGHVFLRDAETGGEVWLLGARLGGALDCDGAQLRAGERGVALAADGLQAEGTVFLRGAETTGEVRLLGARLSGDLDFDGAQLRAGERGTALAADGLQAEGYVFLRGAETAGEVRLLSARLGGGLDCRGAQLRAGERGVALAADGLQAEGTVFLRGAETAGEVRLLGARLGGDLNCDGARLRAGESGVALNADQLSANGALFWRGVKGIDGVLDLTGAEVGALCDDRDSWPKPSDLMLNRFRYGAITGTGAPLDASARIDWLDLQDPARWGADFWPQPWEQCAKVLREMGHREDARRILIAKEARLRAARRARTDGWARYTLLLWDTVLARVTGYGYRPFRAFYPLLALWLYGAFVFWDAARVDSIKPNDPFVLRSAEWAYCAPDYEQAIDEAPFRPRNDGARSQLACFRDQPEAQGYPAFNALVYSADTLLPVVEVEMQAFWLPDDRHPYGAVARYYLWVHIALGWAFSILAVAGFTGLIRTEDTE
jgi:hypothetical protein